MSFINWGEESREQLEARARADRELAALVEQALNVQRTRNQGTVTGGGSKSKNFLELVFDNIVNADLLVGDSANVDDWNGFFDLPNWGTPFTSVKVEGNRVKLTGGAGIETQFRLFSDYEHLLEIWDYSGSIVRLGDETFGGSGGYSNLTKAHFPEVVEILGDPANYGALGQCYSLEYVYLPKCTTVGASTFYYSTSINDDNLILPFSEITVLEDYTFTATSIQNVDRFENLTRIGNDCFYSAQISGLNLTKLTYCGSFAFNNGIVSGIVNLPNLVEAGENCFSRCDMTAASLPKLVTTGPNLFYNSSSLATVSLDALTDLPNNSFYECSSLQTITAPNLTSIGEFCFAQSGLTDVNFPSVVSAGNNCFENSLVVTAYLPNATSLGVDAFRDCGVLTSVNLDSLSSLPDYAFGYNCASLQSVSLSSATTLGNAVFFNCHALNNVNAPLVETMGDICFYGCSALTSISLPALKTAGGTNFSFCSSLTTVSMPLLETAGDNCIANIASLTTLSLPSLVTAGEGCFQSNPALTSVSLPSATSIGNACFYNNNALTSIYLPACTSLGSTTGDNAVFNLISGKTIVLTVPAALMTCNSGNPDGDIQYLLTNNPGSTIVQV